MKAKHLETWLVKHSNYSPSEMLQRFHILRQTPLSNYSTEGFLPVSRGRHAEDLLTSQITWAIFSLVSLNIADTVVVIRRLRSLGAVGIKSRGLEDDFRDWINNYTRTDHKIIEVRLCAGTEESGALASVTMMNEGTSETIYYVDGQKHPDLRADNVNFDPCKFYPNIRNELVLNSSFFDELFKTLREDRHKEKVQARYDKVVFSV